MSNSLTQVQCICPSFADTAILNDKDGGKTNRDLLDNHYYYHCQDNQVNKELWYYHGQMVKPVLLSLSKRTGTYWITITTIIAKTTGTCWRRTTASSRWRRSLRASCSWSRTVAMVPLSLSSRYYTLLILSRQSMSAFSST